MGTINPSYRFCSMFFAFEMLIIPMARELFLDREGKTESAKFENEK